MVRYTKPEHILGDIFFPIAEIYESQCLGSGLTQFGDKDEFPKEPFVTVNDFVNFYITGIQKIIEESLENHKAVKIELIVNVQMKKEINQDSMKYISISLSSSTHEVYETTDLDKFLKVLIEKIEKKWENVYKKIQETEWVLDRFLDIELKISAFKPLSSGSFLRFQSPLLKRRQL